MFGFSGPEILLTFTIGLLVLGPAQIKQVVKFIAKIFKGVKKAAAEITTYLESTLEEKK